MCFFNCNRRLTNNRLLMNLNRYEPYNCEMCRNQKKLKNLQYCGRFSIQFENLSECHPDLSTLLINQQGKSNYIHCVKCKQNFFLDKKDNHINVFKFTCNHSQIKFIKQCISCRQLIKKKQYQKCKKCQLSLLFFNISRQVKCPRCGIICCESCKNEMQLFSQQFCNCKIIKYSKNVTCYTYLVSAIILIIILALIGSYYLENSEYYQSMVCTIKDGYSNVNCTQEQLYKDSLKQLILFIGLILVMCLVPALFESFTLLRKSQLRQQRAIRNKFR
ncbi:unnamed protein product [Paramecium pentaurelia]|uniref:Uncharacterized protein n=1 Tax=Paramecium pentaurelia TaxID=43138 RepID=A0A8S1Y069_9CILI|nr:unnamed protein product [Paramecium pentaurelia]